jgi:hypothetical protein
MRFRKQDAPFSEVIMAPQLEYPFRPGDRVRIETSDPDLKDINDLAGQIVQCGGAGLTLVELDESPRVLGPRRVWVTTETLQHA